MIKSVTVTNYLNESLNLNMADPYSTGLAITEITGLGPAKANINMTEISTDDGAKFNSSRITNRNITISLKFMPNMTIDSINTVEKCRQKTYKYFPIKKQIVFTIETDNRTAKVIGYIESNEPDIFSKESGCKISIICPDPWWYGVKKENNYFGGVDKMFSFPFSNKLGTKSLTLGEIAYDSTKFIYYEGDSSTGMVMTMHATGPLSGITIFNTRTNEYMKIDDTKLKKMKDLSSGIEALDDIEISTLRGNKYIHLIRGGKVYNILNALDKSSSWFTLEKGINCFAYSVDESSTSSPKNAQFYITTQVIYEGV